MNDAGAAAQREREKKKESWMSNSVEIPQPNYSPSTDMSSIICAAAHVINGRFKARAAVAFSIRSKPKQNIKQKPNQILKNKIMRQNQERKDLLRCMRCSAMRLCVLPFETSGKRETDWPSPRGPFSRPAAPPPLSRLSPH